MGSYDAPGVYYERSDARPPLVPALRTDVAAFVGIARQGPLHQPVPVESWRQFESVFGSFTGTGYLAYAVRAFFENGGRRCWVVRVAAAAAARCASALLRAPAPAGAPAGTPGREAWRVRAASPGSHGNRLRIELRETHRAQTVAEPLAGGTGPEHDERRRRNRERPPGASAVASTSGFSAGTLVRLTQGMRPEAFRVVADVDPVRAWLFWEHEDPARRLYDRPLSGFDPDLPLMIESVEYTLLVRSAGRVAAVYDALSLVPEHARYGPRVLAPWRLDSAGGAGALPAAAPAPIVIEELRPEFGPDFRRDYPGSLREVLATAPLEPLDGRAAHTLEGGGDGLAALAVDDFIGEEVSPYDRPEVAAARRLGLRALERVDEVSIVAVPDIHIRPLRPPDTQPPPPCAPDPCLSAEPPVAGPAAAALEELPPVFSDEQVYRVQAALVRHCEEAGDRVALLDPPYSAARDDASRISAVAAWRRRFDTKFAALYYPWVRVVEPVRGLRSVTRDVPPSGHVAGQCARSELKVGVHKAPANEPLEWALDVTAPVDPSAHGLLNPLGVNLLRALGSRGVRILGARTLSSDASWQDLNVRRLLIMIEEALDISTQWAAFEPNDFGTRAKLRLSISSFLIALWQQGALVGAAANEAFFVKCDEENNPPEQRDRGWLVAEVGVAPSRPFEFVVVRVGRAHNALEVEEQGAVRGVA